MSDSGQGHGHVRHRFTEGSLRRGPRDRRIQRTDTLLRGALASLIHEKPYERIAVKEILHRANVGRSAFYTHFSSKDDLLFSCIHDVLHPPGTGWRREPVRPYEALVWFSLPMFDHIEKQRRSSPPTVSNVGRRAMHRCLQEVITQLIEEEVRSRLRRRCGSGAHGSPELLARWIASTFMLVLNWWVESENPLPAAEVDHVFRDLVEPSLAVAFR